MKTFYKSFKKGPFYKEDCETPASLWFLRLRKGIDKNWESKQVYLYEFYGAAATRLLRAKGVAIEYDDFDRPTCFVLKDGSRSMCIDLNCHLGEGFYNIETLFAHRDLKKGWHIHPATWTAMKYNRQSIFYINGQLHISTKEQREVAHKLLSQIKDYQNGN